MPSPLILGPVAFVGFEVPERLAFGGRQRLAVHRLPGGGRVIDAMGRDDDELVWQGVFSGPDAADRARALDALRAAGEPLPLTWDAFLYTVVISRFAAEFSSPWWIPYRIACTVLRDEAAVPVARVSTLVADLAADLAAAAPALDVSAAQAAIAADGATIAGTAAQSAALGTLGSARAAVEAGIGAAGSGLDSPDLSAVLEASAQLAQLAAARGYLARAAINLGNASA